MPVFKNILFPVDFSEQTRGLANHVACMASRYQAHVTMLNVIEIPSAVDPIWPEYSGVLDYRAVVDERKERLHGFLRSEFETISVNRVTVAGDPGRMIAEYADQEKMDLIMMPTHGYGPFRQFLLGSVTAKTLHHAHCPVWTSAHLSDIAKPPTGYQDVLCALDLTANSLPLLRWARAFVCERGGTLKLVHAIPAARQPYGLDLEGDRFRASLYEMANTSLANLQLEAGTNCETILAAGEPADVIRDAAEESHSDLVIIGRGVMQETFGRMRTNVYSIVRQSPCPLISV